LSPLVGSFDVSVSFVVQISVLNVIVQVYYVPSGSNDPYPPDITSYLASIGTKVGAEVTWQETNFDVYDNFAATGKPSPLDSLSFYQ
jgi:hypothetical protein